ncbi:MAG: hypothetical protein ACR65W_05875, partial [Methylocystis sp.]
NPQPRLFPPRSSEIVSIIDSGHDPRATRTTIAAVSPNRQTALGGGLRLSVVQDKGGGLATLRDVSGIGESD